MTVKRATFSILLTLTLVACTPPLEDGAYQDIPAAQADKVAAGVNEPVKVTVTGGYAVDQKYYLEEFVQPGVSLGACFSYTSDAAIEGGLCSGGKQPIPSGLSMLNSTTFTKDFGDIVVRRGEHRKVEHTFTFTSAQPGEIMVMPVYQFDNGPGVIPRTEPGVQNTVRVTFK